MSDIVDKLSAAAFDPMWANHVEIRKSTLAVAVNEILALREREEMMREAIMDLRAAHLMRPSCQARLVARCKCVACADERAVAALAPIAAEPAQPAPVAQPVAREAGQPVVRDFLSLRTALPPEDIEALFGAIASARTAARREALEIWEKALKQAWQCADPLHPPGAPGSYARGNHNGFSAALETVRANAEALIRALPDAQG